MPTAGAGWARVSTVGSVLALCLCVSVRAAEMATIPGGPFLMGSTPEEREYGYALDEARGSTAARRWRWFAVETPRRPDLPVFQIDRHPVTNRAYAEFVDDTGHPAPHVDEGEWIRYRLVHDYAAVRRFLWIDGGPPPGREDHPVVLVGHESAAAYCAWRGARAGRILSLPSEAQWEKAARGTDGRYFPWGDRFEPHRLNSVDGGPYDTVPVGAFPEGASPFGVLDMAGQVFEWTATPFRANRVVVKGGSWDDYPGVTRSAARHGRPPTLKHILIGFRCATPAAP